jgi:site-specific DNA-methyltransferase (adenine-specific)
MNRISDQSINMILCDLPYGTTQCKWDSVLPFDKLWAQYQRIIKPNGAIVLFGAQPFTSVLISSNLKLFKYTWVWEKSKATGFLNAKRRPLVAHEDIMVFCDGTPPYYPIMSEGTPYDKGVRKDQTGDDVYGKFDQAHIKNESGQRYPRSVVYFKTAESEGKTFHKTQKPVALLEYLIRTYTNEGETVLDNCFGSGSTTIAAINSKRNFIGFELDANYYELAKNRVNQYIIEHNLQEVYNKIA